MSNSSAYEASRQSDAKLRAALESGDTSSVQLDPRTTKMRDQVLRTVSGKSGRKS
jgi:hypothetical protein